MHTNLVFYVYFILCNLINKPYTKILTVICEIHQFHLHFYTAFFSFAHWRFVFSKIRPAYRVWDVFQVLLGRIATIVIGYFRVQSSYKKNFLKPFKTCRILAGRPLRNHATAPRSSRHQSRNRPIFCPFPFQFSLETINSTVFAITESLSSIFHLDTTR